MNLTDLRAELIARSEPIGADTARLVAVRHRIEVIRRRRALTVIVLACMAGYLISAGTWLRTTETLAAGFPRFAAGAELVATAEDLIRTRALLSITAPLDEGGLVLGNYCDIPAEASASIVWWAGGHAIAETACAPTYNEYFRPDLTAWTDAGLRFGTEVTLSVEVHVVPAEPVRPGSRFAVAVLRPVDPERYPGPSR